MHVSSNVQQSQFKVFNCFLAVFIDDFPKAFINLALHTASPVKCYASSNEVMKWWQTIGPETNRTLKLWTTAWSQSNWTLGT